MKWILMAVTTALVCVLFTLGGVPPVASAANAQSMDQPEPVLGTLLSAQTMYDTGEITRFSGQLRIDQGTPALTAGTTCAVRFAVPNTTFFEAVPGAGDQISVKLCQQPGSTGSWEAVETPALLGRGELLRPGEGATLDAGSPEARLLVKMLAPLATDCHQRTAQLLRDFDAREPDRVRIQLFDTNTVAGRQEIRRERLSCATVLVNNRYQFTLDGPNGKRQVALHHHPNDPRSSYNSEDVISVIEQELKRLYPQ